jgi:alpha-tubulin suppressor-like RCC1 family protein
MRILSCALACGATLLALAWPQSASATPYGPVAWGLNGGQLGSGFAGPEDCEGFQISFACSRFPLEVSGLKEGQVTALAGGEKHSLALLKDGAVMAWGYNGFGQLGDGNEPSSAVPVEVKGLKDATAVAAGYYHSLAVRSNGTVMTWGLNERGQLGDGRETYRNIPVEVTGLKEARAVAGGGAYSLALLKDGKVMAWGDNHDGQLGNGNETSSDVPVEVKGLSEVTAIAAGEADGLALLKNGTVMAWGSNTEGVLGDGNNTNSNVPVQVTGLTEVAAIAGGSLHNAALLKDGTVRDWGDGFQGALGTGEPNGGSDVPVEVTGLHEVTAIATGGYHSLARLRDGKLMVWGSDFLGQLGIGSKAEYSDVPVEVKGVREVTAIAAGRAHTLVLGRQLFGSPPFITGLSPNRGSARGGTLVTITGKGFAGVPPRVLFGAHEAIVKSNSETSMVVESPAGTGKVRVVVTTPSGTSPASGKTAKHAKFKYTRH